MLFIREKLSLQREFRPTTLFLAEGDSEAMVFEKILEGEGGVDNNNNAIFVIKGIDRFREKVRSISREPNFRFVENIGILVDADENVSNREQQILDAMGEVGFPHHRGSIINNVIDGGRKRTGIYISPGYRTSTPKSLNSFGSISEKSLSISAHSESRYSILWVFLISIFFAIRNAFSDFSTAF